MPVERPDEGSSSPKENEQRTDGRLQYVQSIIRLSIFDRSLDGAYVPTASKPQGSVQRRRNQDQKDEKVAKRRYLPRSCTPTRLNSAVYE